MGFPLNVFSSTGDGVNWQDLGVVLKANNAGTWPIQAIWGSNGPFRTTAGGRPEFVLFVTGCSNADARLQRIGLAKSANGHNFSRPLARHAAGMTLGK